MSGHDLPLVSTVAAALGSACVLGVAARKMGLSPLVGYLVAGIVIGPFTPGFVGDVHLASQLAEIGVILLMFGVGLHFHLDDLLAVRRVAVPGAVVQSAGATLLGLLVGRLFGWTPSSGLVFGMALAVASTVVLLRQLEDAGLVESAEGHVAVGWLIVEDVLTVIALVVIPLLGPDTVAASTPELLRTLGLALGKLAILAALVLVVGARVVPRVLEQVVRLRSRELFTLTVLAVAVTVASVSYVSFGVSMALGAFLAGMVVGQTRVSQQAAADALPLRDAFAVIFFVAAGMLFDVGVVFRAPGLLLLSLAVVLLGKPLLALLVVALLGYPLRTGLVVALGLAQIGEFSFIVGQAARESALLSDGAYSVLVGCAIVSIALNPILFALLPRLQAAARARPKLWRALNARAERQGQALNAQAGEPGPSPRPLAVVVGYGPVGRSVDGLLRESALDTVIVDLSLETVIALQAEGRRALFGDASHASILKQAGLPHARFLVITLPHSVNRGPLIVAARQLNPECRILVRARYLRERGELEQAGADAAVYEEAEAAVALAGLVREELARAGLAEATRTGSPAGP